MSDLISKQVLELWNRYKPTIAVDAIEYDRELKKLLGTNLAEVGTDLISRQAAIDLLKQMRKDGDMVPWEGKNVFARIRELPAEHGTNLAEVGTDCISRQQAINALDECYCGGEDSCGEPWVYKENAVEAIQMIEPIPPAQPKRGKWICTGSPDESWGMMYECSICGNRDYGGNYCSYCGAKMEDENERPD